MQTYIELGETGRKRTHLSLFSLCSPPQKKSLNLVNIKLFELQSQSQLTQI